MNNNGFKLNALSMEANTASVLADPVVSSVKPQIKKMINVMVNVGMVVNIIYLIWVNKSVPAIAGARLVVSERGDILSPK